jgi:hypothetical protein
VAPVTPGISFAPLTDSLVEFCKGLEALLNANIATLAYGGNVARVFYGEQDRYPTVPAYCIEPVRKTRDLDSMKMQRIYDIYFTAQIICYLSQVDSSDQVIREKVDLLGEEVERIIHTDHELGGLTMDLIVLALESGYAYKDSGKYKAVILTVQGRSREGLPC